MESCFLVVFWTMASNTILFATKRARPDTGLEDLRDRILCFRSVTSAFAKLAFDRGKVVTDSILNFTCSSITAENTWWQGYVVRDVRRYHEKSRYWISGDEAAYARDLVLIFGTVGQIAKYLCQKPSSAFKLQRIPDFMIFTRSLSSRETGILELLHSK